MGNLIPITVSESKLIDKYGIRCYADLRNAFLRTRNEGLAALYAKWSAANAAYAASL